MTLRVKGQNRHHERSISVFKHADMVGLKDHMSQFKDAYLSDDHSHNSGNDMWVKFEGCGKVYPIKNDQSKILCAVDQCNDQTACKKEEYALPSYS